MPDHRDIQAEFEHLKLAFEKLSVEFASLKATHRFYRTGFWLLLAALCILGFFHCRDDRNSNQPAIGQG